MPKAPASTRDRILEACRRLFNERGPVAVTTAEIAATVGINEGNLYYYFKTKEQILRGLFERFEAALKDLQTWPMPPLAERAAAGEAPFMERQMAFFDLVWTWRFLYRDGLPLMALAPGLREGLTAHAASTQVELERTLQQMVDDGLLALPAAQIPVLATNAWIVSTYWLHYLQYNRGVRRITRAHLRGGYEQVRALYAPYLRGAAPGGAAARTAADPAAAGAAEATPADRAA